MFLIKICYLKNGLFVVVIDMLELFVKEFWKSYVEGIKWFL